MICLGSLALVLLSSLSQLNPWLPEAELEKIKSQIALKKISNFPLGLGEGECGVNEIYKTCGSSCPVTCLNYLESKPCDQVCVTGCFCEEGYVRGPDGQCIMQEDCPMVASMSPCEQEKITGSCDKRIARYFYNRDSERCERFVYGGCGGNDNNFRSVEECKATCQFAGFQCPEAYGKFIYPGDCSKYWQCEGSRAFLRECEEGEFDERMGCIAYSSRCHGSKVMWKPETTTMFDDNEEYNNYERKACDDNEYYTECGPYCEQTCSDQEQEMRCRDGCKPGCFCKNGYVRSYDRRCIPEEQC